MTLSSDDTNYPSLERKIPNTLNVSKDNFIGREEFEESLRLDFCCYVDPLNNCNSFVSGNRQSSNQKCITNLGKYSTLKNELRQEFKREIIIRNMDYNFGITIIYLPNFLFRYIKPRRNQRKDLQLQEPKYKIGSVPSFTLRLDRTCIFDNHGRIHIISCQVKTQFD